MSHLGLLEREAASIINASLLQMAVKHVNAFKRSLLSVDLPNAKIFLSQNDGTLVDAKYAMEYPVYTFSSGPTNSLRGAS